MRKGMALALTLLAVGPAVLAGPRLVVDPEVYDFGTVAEGLMVEAVFTLTNAGDAPLEFSRQPATSCGCTSAPLPKSVLAPGESMELVAYFDSTNFGGRQIRKYVYVYTNDPTGERRTLAIVGYVRDAAPYESSASTLHAGFYILIDLRTPEEYARGHLLGAINIPFPALTSWLDRLPKRLTIYFYDATGQQAAQATQMLRDQGFYAVQAVAGGLLGWWYAMGDAFIVWAEGVEPIPPPGEPYYGGNTVKPQELANSYQVILDLRAPEAFAAGHFPGAVNLSLQEVPDWAQALPSSGTGRLYIWVVDEDGTVACQAAQWLRGSGYPHARCVIGGLHQWEIRYGELALWPEG